MVIANLAICAHTSTNVRCVTSTVTFETVAWINRKQRELSELTCYYRLELSTVKYNLSSDYMYTKS